MVTSERIAQSRTNVSTILNSFDSVKPTKYKLYFFTMQTCKEPIRFLNHVFFYDCHSRSHFCSYSRSHFPFQYPVPIPQSQSPFPFPVPIPPIPRFPVPCFKDSQRKHKLAQSTRKWTKNIRMKE